LLVDWRSRIVIDGEYFDVLAFVLLKRAAQHVQTPFVDVKKGGFGGDVSTAHSSFRYAFSMLFGVASDDKDHLDAKAVVSGPARLFERNFSKGCFKRKRSSPIDVIVDEAFHLTACLLTETHVPGNVLRFWQPNRTPCSDGFSQQTGRAKIGAERVDFRLKYGEQ